MMTHDEAQELLAAYALHAVENPERRDLEEHLAECPRCASELDGLRDVATTLGNVGGAAPADLWNRIAERLYDNEERDEVDVPPICAFARPVAPAVPAAAVTPLFERGAASSRRTKYVAVTFAAAAALLIGVLSVNLVRANSRVAQLNSALSLAGHSVVDAALETPGHVNVTLNGAHSGDVATFVLVNGAGYLVSSNMTALAPDKTYQLWAITKGTPISIGLMGAHPSTVYFSIAGAAGPGELAITVEPAGGSVAPTSPVLAAGRISA